MASTATDYFGKIYCKACQEWHFDKHTKVSEGEKNG